MTFYNHKDKRCFMPNKILLLHNIDFQYAMQSSVLCHIHPTVLYGNFYEILDINNCCI